MGDIIQAEKIDKRYDGVHALKSVSLSVAEGEVHALVGENGAGKSTLGKVIAGVVRADSGVITVAGSQVSIATPLDAQKLGVAIIFQELDLFPNLTVGENIVIGNLKVEHGFLVDFRAVERFCRRFLDEVGLRCSAGALLQDLPIGEVQLVAIARALSMDARLIVMDEPTSSLADDAVDNLFRVIRSLKERGVAVVYVSHKMKEIFAIADRITVLRDGEVIGTKAAADTNIDEIIAMMVGRQIGARVAASEPSLGDPLFTVQGLTTAKLRDVSFDLRAGEVLGIAGLVGAGRSEIGAALFGLDRRLAGTIRLGGEIVAPRSPRQAMRCGIGYLPEDRKLQGLMMQGTVRENSSIALLHRLQTLGFVRTGDEGAKIGAVHQRTRLKAASYEAPVSSLSGGNQQKVLIAKWLLVDPRVMFLDDPTRGIDIGAKQDVYELIAELAAKGKGVMFVSSELPELLRCCNRIMVMHEGKVAGVVDAATTTEEEIMALAVKSDAA
jgi:ABC-type sugar transport system ATPase subunit